MAKKNPDKSSSPVTTLAERENSIQKKKNELDSLQRVLAGLDKKGDKVDKLMNRIQAVILEITDEQGSLQKFKKDPSVFADKLARVSKEMNKIKHAIEELKTEAPEPEDVKPPEVKPVVEDIEYVEWKQKKTDAEENLKEFVGYIKNHKLEEGKEGVFKDLDKKLAELDVLLESRDYQKFADAHTNFNDILENLYAQAEEDIKKRKEAAVAQIFAKAEEPAEPQPVNTKKEREEWQKRKIAYENAEYKFDVLKAIITNREEDKEKIAVILKPFVAELKRAGTSRRAAEVALKAKNGKDFAENLQNFEKAIAEILSKVNPDIKKLYEAKKSMPVKRAKQPEPEKNEPVAKKEEPTQEAAPATPSPTPGIPAAPKDKKDVFGKDITKIKSVDLKSRYVPAQKPVSEPSPVVAEVVQPAATELSQEPTPAVSEAVPATEQPPAPPSPPETPVLEPQKRLSTGQEKKGLWSRFKEGVSSVFNRETGKAVGKMSYNSVTSALGIKLATDAVLWAATGKGDLAMWWKGRKESKESVESIAAALKSITELSDKANKSKALDESAKTGERLVDFKTQVESAKIPDEARKALLDRLEGITAKNQEDLEKAKRERDEEIRKVMEVYEERKVSGMVIARDAMNFALTASGFLLLRGIMYAGVSVAERARKARKEYAKEKLDEGAKKAELKFVAKDVLVNAAIETARALTMQGAKKGSKTKKLDFIKAVGTVARGFGIYGVAISGAELPQHTLDKLISSIKENGVASTISHNFIQNVEHVAQNAERVGHLAAHPTEVLSGHTNLAPQPIEHHEVPVAPEHVAVAPVEQTHPLEHPSTFKPHEAPVPTETDVVEHGDHTVAVEVLNNREGVLNGVNKIIHNHPDVFTHPDGKAWTAAEIHTWKVRELKAMGFKIEGDKWGNPMTVHAGAQVEVFTDEQGQPHFKLASDEHVTFNKNYNWTEAKHADVAPTAKLTDAEKETYKVVDTGAVAGREGDYLINPLPDNYGVGHASALNIVDTGAVAGREGDYLINPYADGNTESAITHTPIKVDANIRDIAIVHHTPPESAAVQPAKAAGVVGKESKSFSEAQTPKDVKVSAEKTPVAPEVALGTKTAEQFLQEHNSNPKDFVATYDKMVDGTIDRLEDSLIFRGGADKFLQSRIDALYNTGITQGNIAGVDSRSFALMEKILNAEDKFKLNQPDWLKTFSQTMFEKSDKAMRLALLPDRDVLLEPIKTNGGHAARIWDETEQKDVYYYDKDSTFNTNEDGRLIVEDGHGKITLLNQKEALKMSEAE